MLLRGDIAEEQTVTIEKVYCFTFALTVLLTANPVRAGNLTRKESARAQAPAGTTTSYRQPIPRLPSIAPSPVRSLLDARESEANARKVRSDLGWSNSLADAKQRARQQGKMIFWVHMLGKLDGAT
ncbi:MAG: hypothetical protein K2W95_11920 [Candidatus Obscuribacterales bacterium]|nr:hypothetical protein [Candidatus Obscuribacterales bacterium]